MKAMPQGVGRQPTWRSAMGGGRRLCELAGCKKIAESGGTQHCKAHGGGRRCQHEGCPKQAVTGGLPTCIAHGGGKRCQHEGCFKTVAQFPGSVYCTLCLRRGVAAPSPPVSHAVLPPQPSPAHARKGGGRTSGGGGGRAVQAGPAGRHRAGGAACGSSTLSHSRALHECGLASVHHLPRPRCCRSVNASHTA